MVVFIIKKIYLKISFSKAIQGSQITVFVETIPLCLMFDTPGPDYWLQYVAQTLNQQVNVHAPAEFCEKDIANSTPHLANLEDGWSQVVHLGFFFFFLSSRPSSPTSHGQQSKQKFPDLLLLSHHLQLFWWDPEEFTTNHIISYVSRDMIS